MTHSPPHSARLWHDREALYVELASGLITKFPFTEGGLSKVLKLLRQESLNAPANGHSMERLPKLKAPVPKPNFTEAQREAAKNILRGVKK